MENVEVVQLRKGKLYRPLGLGDLRYLLPFEADENNVFLCASGMSHKTRTQSMYRIPCSLYGKKLPFVYLGHVGSRAGLVLVEEHSSKSSWSKGASKYTLERVNNRVVQVKIDDLSDSFIRTVHCTPTNYGFNARNIEIEDEWPAYNFSWDRLGDEYRWDQTHPDPVGLNPGKDTVKKVAELLQKLRIPIISYSGERMGVHQDYPIVACNCSSGKNLNQKHGKVVLSGGFGAYAIVNFNGYAIALVCSVHEHYNYKVELRGRDVAEVVEELKQLRAKQVRRDETAKAQKLRKTIKSYTFEDHDGMVVCKATMGDGVVKLARISEINKRSHDGKLEVRIHVDTNWEGVILDPLQYPFIEEHGLKGFFARSDNLEAEVLKVNELRKRYWTKRVGKWFVKQEQIQKNRLEAKHVVYYVVADKTHGGIPVECEILENNVRIPGMETEFIRFRTPDGAVKVVRK